MVRSTARSQRTQQPSQPQRSQNPKGKQRAVRPRSEDEDEDVEEESDEGEDGTDEDGVVVRVEGATDVSSSLKYIPIFIFYNLFSPCFRKFRGGQMILSGLHFSQSKNEYHSNATI